MKLVTQQAVSVAAPHICIRGGAHAAATPHARARQSTHYLHPQGTPILQPATNTEAREPSDDEPCPAISLPGIESQALFESTQLQPLLFLQAAAGGERKMSLLLFG